MRNQRLIPCLTLVSCLAVTPSLFAQRVTERSLLSGSVGSGARALGMGGAFIAVADDATASSWNPAGLCVLEKAEASVVYQPYASYSTAYAPSVYTYSAPIVSPTYSSVGQYDAEQYKATSRAFDFASITFPFRIGSLKLVPQIGYQRVIDFGLDAEYGSPWVTTTISRVPTTSTTTSRYVDVGDNDTSGGLDVVSASLGLSFTPKLYLGVGVSRWRNGSDGKSTYSWRANSTDSRGSYASSQIRTANAVEEFSGTSVSVGALLKPTEKLRFGLVYKSSATLDYEYAFSSHTEQFSDRAATSVFDRQTDRTGTIKWPWSLGAGIAFQPKDSLTISLDVTRTNWSEATADYTTVATVSRTAPTPSSSVTTTFYASSWPTAFDQNLPESAYNPRQTDSTQVRFGTEYVITQPRFLGLTALPLRLGFLDDQQLFKSRPDLGSVHYLGLTGGFGLVWARLSVDLAYVHTRGDYKCCEYNDIQFPDASGGYKVDYRQENDAFRSHRFFLSSTVRF